MDDLRLYNALLADLNKATYAWLSDLYTVESANVYKAKTLLAAGWTKPPVDQQVEPANWKHCDICGVWRGPTHWQPLPAPPKEST